VNVLQLCFLAVLERCFVCWLYVWGRLLCAAAQKKKKEEQEEEMMSSSCSSS